MNINTDLPYHFKEKNIREEDFNAFFFFFEDKRW